MIKLRMEWADIAKGYAIIIVVLGHLITSGPIHKAIYSFHMIAFVFLSGIFVKKRNTFREFIKKDIWLIIKAYLYYMVIWAVIWYIYILLLYPHNEAKSLPIYLGCIVLGVFLGNGNITDTSMGAIWFLPMLVTVKLLFYALQAGSAFIFKIYSKYIMIALSIVAHVIGVVLLNGCSNTIWYISTALTSLIFYVTGAYSSPVLRKIDQAKWSNILGIMLLSAVSWIALMSVSGDVNLGRNSYDSPFTMGITATLGICVLFCFSVLCVRLPKSVKRVITFFGQNSLHVMGWHSQFRILLVYLFSLIGINNKILSLGGNFIITIALCIPFCIISSNIINIERRKQND